MELIWRVAMYTGQYNLHLTCPVAKCFKKLVSNPSTIMLLPFRRYVSTQTLNINNSVLIYTTCHNRVSIRGMHPWDYLSTMMGDNTPSMHITIVQSSTLAKNCTVTLICKMH